jgi:hypothetical protein
LVSSIRDVSIGGATGKVVTVTPISVETLTTFDVGGPVPGTYGLAAGEEVEIYIVDVAGTPVAVVAQARSSVPEVETLRTLIDSIVWKDLADE